MLISLLFWLWKSRLKRAVLRSSRKDGKSKFFRRRIFGLYFLALYFVHCVCPNKLCINYSKSTLKSTSLSVCFRGISRLSSAFIFLQWFKIAHIHIQLSALHDGCKQGIDKQMFNRKWISRQITHPQSLFKKDCWCVILREIHFLLKICWSIPCWHPSWTVLQPEWGRRGHAPPKRTC